jgi:hypothetical protein
VLALPMSSVARRPRLHGTLIRRAKFSLRKVRLAELTRHLHPRTDRVTPAQRSDSLRARMLATARRYRE